MNARLKLWVSGCVLLGSMGCVVDLDASYVEVQHAVAPDASCTYSVGNGVQSSGIYDPIQQDVSSAYRLVLLLRNNMQLAASDALAFGSVSNVRDQGTNVEIIGVEGCWYQYSGAVQELGDYKTGEVVDCATIPAQSGSIPALTEVDAGGGQALVGVEVLNPTMLKTIFGPTFDIRQVANNVANYESDGAFLAAPADTATRDPNWGVNYPTTRNAQLIVQLRAVGTDQGGLTRHSNWIAYPINFCPTCLNYLCGVPQNLPCPNATCALGGACGDGVPTASGAPTCKTTNTQCGGLTGFQGFQQNTTSGSICLPAQGDTQSITCQAFTDCQGTVN